MVPFKGFLAVAAACFTSGLAGVYFEMVLKNSTADLWVRNVQLSLFSLLPALVPYYHGSVTFPRCSRAQCPLAHTPVCQFHAMGLGDRHHPGPGWTSHSPCNQIRRQYHEGLCHFSVDCDILSRLCRALPFPISRLHLSSARALSLLLRGSTPNQTANNGSAQSTFKFLRARRTSNAPLPVSPMPTRPYAQSDQP
jgi:hypothetical protein